MTDQATPAKVRLTDWLGPRRDAVLRELDDATNQTWRGKRSRWAELVRAQDAAIQMLRIQVIQADERDDLATRRAHAALAVLERIEKTPGEDCFEYRRMALEALAADERLLNGT